MTVVKYGTETWTLRKAEEDLLDIFQRNCLRIVLGTRLTDLIFNSRLYEKGGSIPLSRAIMKERLRWLGYVLWMKDDRLPNIVLFGQPSRAKRVSRSSPFGVGGCHKEKCKEKGNFLGGCKEVGYE